MAYSNFTLEEARKIFNLNRTYAFSLKVPLIRGFRGLNR